MKLTKKQYKRFKNDEFINSSIEFLLRIMSKNPLIRTNDLIDRKKRKTETVENWIEIIEKILLDEFLHESLKINLENAIRVLNELRRVIDIEKHSVPKRVGKNLDRDMFLKEIIHQLWIISKLQAIVRMLDDPYNQKSLFVFAKVKVILNRKHV